MLQVSCRPPFPVVMVDDAQSTEGQDQNARNMFVIMFFFFSHSFPPRFRGGSAEGKKET